MNKKIIKLFICLLFLSGCSSTNGLVTSFEDITTESQSEGWFKIKQSKVISVPGLLPFADVGSVQFYKSKRNPSTTIGLSDGDSYILESIIDYKSAPSFNADTVLITIKNEIIKIPNLIDILAENKIYLSELKVKTLNLEKKIAEYSIELKKLEDKENKTVEEKSLFSEKQKLISSNNNLLTKLRGAEIDASVKYIQSKEKLNTALNTVNDKINKHGIIVYRWNTTSKKSGSVSADKTANLSLGNSKNYNGIALISGLRIATLYLGDDFLETWKDDQAWLFRLFQFTSRFQLTTYVVQAKHIIYISESSLQSYLNSKLKLSLDKLPEEIRQLDELEIATAFSKLQNLSNVGVIGNIKRQKIPVNWNNDNDIENVGLQSLNNSKPELTLDKFPEEIRRLDELVITGNTEREKNSVILNNDNDIENMPGLQSLDGWHTFYSVQSDLRETINMLKQKKNEMKIEK